jgi:hypothetical protein
MRCYAINVKARKLLGRSAIRIVAGGDNEDRIRSGSYLALRTERARRKRAEEDLRRPQDSAGSEDLPDFLR